VTQVLNGTVGREPEHPVYDGQVVAAASERES